MSAVSLLNSLLFSFDREPPGIYEGSPDQAVLQIADTQKLYQAWKQNRNLTVSVNFKDRLQFGTLPNAKAGQITKFSSIGPGEQLDWDANPHTCTLDYADYAHCS